MTIQERAEFLKLYILTAAYFRERFPDEVLRMYVEDLMDIPAPDLKRALVQYRKDRRNRRTPMPADLIAILNPSQNDDDKAAEIGALVLKAVSRKGYTWTSLFRYEAATFKEAAIKELGTAGFEIVHQMGGWDLVCKFVDETPASVAQKQIKDIAVSVLRKAAAGKLNSKPELPSVASSREESKLLLEAIDQKRNTKE